MPQNENSKQYDLEERTLEFAKSCRAFVKKLPKTIGNIEDGKQLIRSSGSMGANYIEANEALSKKDFIVDTNEDNSLESECSALMQEGTELMMIFSSIMRKSS